MVNEGALDLEPRLQFFEQARNRSADAFEFAEAVLQGLSQEQKALSSRFFYDCAGSALFEEITKLPEYYLTRCEQSILDSAGPEIIEAVGGALSLVEFGSGSARKTRTLIKAALEAQPQLHFTAIDISADFMLESSRLLLQDYEDLSITAIAAEYFESLELLPAPLRRRLFAFLGSNLGNFEDLDAMRFLSAIGEIMTTEDRLLVGIDLAKDASIIEPAYNDGAGVTELFNKNLLLRINRELGANFDLSAFAHTAPYLAEAGRVEMRLTSNRRQRVHIEELQAVFDFGKGEYIHTENSRKYSKRCFEQLVEISGLEIAECWSDPQGWFGLYLLKPSI